MLARSLSFALFFLLNASIYSIHSALSFIFFIHSAHSALSFSAIHSMATPPSPIPVPILILIRIPTQHRRLLPTRQAGKDSPIKSKRTKRGSQQTDRNNNQDQRNPDSSRRRCHGCYHRHESAQLVRNVVTPTKEITKVRIHQQKRLRKFVNHRDLFC